MRAVVTPLLIVLLPGTLSVLGYELLRWVAGGDPPRPVRPLLRGAARIGPAASAFADRLEGAGLLTRHRVEPVPPVLLALELRRLACEVQRIERSDQPHRAARLAAALAAYDSVLVDICRHAQVGTPVGLLPLDPRRRMALEADLVATGFDW